MRKIVVSTFLTLDGIMQAPGGPDEDTEGNFTHGGWSVGYWDEKMEETMGKETSESFEGLLGRKTYDVFAAHWPNVPEDDPGGMVFNKVRKYVVSNNLESVNWENSVLISGNAVDEIKNLKDQDGPDLHVSGSSNLIQTLLKNDLVDELRLKIYPIVIGKGKRLFGDGAIPIGLNLKNSFSTPSGVIVATYKREGEIKKGSFALDQA